MFECRISNSDTPPNGTPKQPELRITGPRPAIMRMEGEIMRKAILAATIGGALLMALPGAVWAHHSHAMFDASKVVTATGTVAGYDYSNPHDRDGRIGYREHLYLSYGSRQDWKERTIYCRVAAAADRGKRWH